MRFGVAVDITKARLCAELGYDYVEVKLNSLEAMSEEDFQKALKEVKALPIKTETGSLLFPKTMDLNTVSEDELSEYLTHLFSRMKALGIGIAVFGSGKSRFIPSSSNWQETFKRMVWVTRVTAKIAEEYDVKIAIEPLNRGETNFVNSLLEGAALESATDRNNVGLLADLYHMRKEGESMDDITLTSPLLHTHIAVLEGRGFPNSDTEEVRDFIRVLKKSGYNGRMSIEGKALDFEKESLESLSVLRKIDMEEI